MSDKCKCWDCRKELKNITLDEEAKKIAPKTPNGFYLIICDECRRNGNNG